MEQESVQPACCYGSQLNEMRLNGEVADMEIIVGSETYRVRRGIMEAKSAIVSSQMKEANQNKSIIEDLDPGIKKTVIEFFYIDQVSLNDDNFHHALSAAFRFCIESLQDVCVKFIESRITAFNCIRLVHSFQQYNDTIAPQSHWILSGEFRSRL